MQQQQQVPVEEMNSPQDQSNIQQFSTPGQGQDGQQNMDNMPMAMSPGPMGAAQQQPGPSMTAMKMKGLPFSVTRQDILNFFQGENMIEDSVKIGVMPDGRLTGEASVLFHTDEECSEAHAKLDQKYIGTRWVKLIRVVMEEYTEFDQDQQSKYGGGNSYGSRRGGRGGYGGDDRGDNGFDDGYRGRGGRGGRGSRGDRGDRGGRGGRGGRGFRGGYGDDNNGYDGGHRGGRGGRGGYGDDRGDQRGGNGGTVRLSDFVNAENQYTALKMRGLPFSVQEREIRDFFQDFRVAERDIKIDMNQGRPTGYALVFFENVDEAGRAKDSLNKKYLGSRYVDLSHPDLR